jgi:3-deoxy-D-arabino-heptulosonate 7-phosphate (DAHP) synthase class II
MSLIRYKQEGQLNFIWMCDPMHGNTYTLNNVKTRNVKEIQDEILEVSAILESQGESL